MRLSAITASCGSSGAAAGARSAICWAVRAGSAANVPWVCASVTVAVAALTAPDALRKRRRETGIRGFLLGWDVVLQWSGAIQHRHDRSAQVFATAAREPIEGRG